MYKIIENLKHGDPKRQEKLLLRMRDNNVAYLKKVNPVLAEYVEKQGTGHYEIRLGHGTLDIVDRNTGQFHVPQGQLFSYMSDLGAWHHTAWVDNIAMRHIYPIGEHGEILQRFYERIVRHFPEFVERSATGKVKLPSYKDGRRFSGAVIFLGVFSGLHIINYLNRTVVRDIFLIEPDPENFLLSCFFVDYEKLERVFGRLLLHVGEDFPENPLEILINRAPVTSAVWVRLLPAYRSTTFDEVINAVALRWQALTEIFVPMDRERQNLVNGAENIKNKVPIFKKTPKLSKGATIAVVGSGPSLSNDMAWLKANQDKLIIICPISASRVLRDNGIRIDFQCTLDTEVDEVLWEPLRLDPKIPLVAYYKINPEIVRRFEQVYLVVEQNKANTVNFKKTIGHTHPTSGNLTMAFAAACEPSRMLLMGLDFGFRDVKESHVKGGYLDDEVGGYTHESEVGRVRHVRVSPNFDITEDIVLTTSYYNTARFGVEAAIETLGEQCEVLNFSDGARIKGAKPVRSGSYELKKYQGLEKDIAKIKAAFSTDYKDVFEVYPTKGKELLEMMKKTLLECVDVECEPLDWKDFTMRLDAAWTMVVRACWAASPEDMRGESYGKLILDLLGSWYRLLLFTETADETAKVYREGVDAIRAVFEEELHWPELLDQVG